VLITVAAPAAWLGAEFTSAETRLTHTIMSTTVIVSNFLRELRTITPC
jgi:hypothetical protein